MEGRDPWIFEFTESKLRSSLSVWDLITGSKRLVLWTSGFQWKQKRPPFFKKKKRKFLLMLVIKFINILKVHLTMKFQRAASFSITQADRPIFDVSFMMD